MRSLAVSALFVAGCNIAPPPPEQPLSVTTSSVTKDVVIQLDAKTKVTHHADGSTTFSCFQPPPYKISELRVAAIIQGESKSVALVYGPKGEEYEIGVGSYLSRNFERVKKITDRCLEGARETRNYETGEKKIEPFSLCMEPDAPELGAE